MTVTFLQISRKPNFDLEPEYFFGKQMNRRFQQYNVCTKILSTFHTRVKYISVKNMLFKPMGTNPPKPPLLGTHGPHLIHPSLNWPHFRITVQQSPYWLQWDAPNSPPKTCPFPFDSHLIHPSLHWPCSPPQMASISNQWFCHNTLFRQTDRHMALATTLYPQHLCSTDSEQRANNNNNKESIYKVLRCATVLSCKYLHVILAKTLRPSRPVLCNNPDCINNKIRWWLKYVKDNYALHTVDNEDYLCVYSQFLNTY